MTTDINTGLYQLRMFDWGTVLCDSDDREHNIIPYSLCLRDSADSKYLKVLGDKDSVFGVCMVNVDEVDDRNCDIYATVSSNTEGSYKRGDALFVLRAPNKRNKIEPTAGEYYARCTAVAVEFMNANFESFDTFSCNDRLFIQHENAGVVKFDKNIYGFDGWQRVNVFIDVNGGIVFTLLENVKKDGHRGDRERICKLLFGTVDVKCLGVAELIRSEVTPWSNHMDADFFRSDAEVVERMCEYIQKTLINEGFNGNPASVSYLEARNKLILSVLLGYPMSEYLWRLRASYLITENDKIIFNQPTRLFQVLKEDGTPYEYAAKTSCPELF